MRRWRGCDMAYYVIFEFPALAAAKSFYVSPEYQSLKALRREASHANIVGVEGVWNRGRLGC